MANAILNFHFDFLTPSLTSQFGKGSWYVRLHIVRFIFSIWLDFDQNSSERSQTLISQFHPRWYPPMGSQAVVPLQLGAQLDYPPKNREIQLMCQYHYTVSKQELDTQHYELIKPILHSNGSNKSQWFVMFSEYPMNKQSPSA